MIKQRYVYIGTWGSDLQGNEKIEQIAIGGIKVYRIDENGQFEFVAAVSPQVNAGIICVSSDKRYLYATDERKDLHGQYGTGGGLCSYRINQKDGSLEFVNEVSSVGAYPANITIDKNSKFCFICNHGNHDDVVTKVKKNTKGIYEAVKTYDDGSIAMFPVNPDGSLGECCDIKVLSGSSINKHQYSPHPHSVSVDPTNKFLIACDKGSDVILVYQIDYRKGKLREMAAFHTAEGTGPRHIAFHPTLPVMYVNSEINNTVNVFSFSFRTGEMKLIDTARTIPDNYVPLNPSDPFAANETADLRVHPNGRFLYVSNRGHNSIVSYKLDGNGKLELLGFTPSGGEIPRSINFDSTGAELYLYAVNQRSGNIVQFGVEENTGNLISTGYELSTNNPVCIQFVKI